MKKMLKDIGKFGMGSIMLGGFSTAAGKVGGAEGLAGMSSMMPVVGQTAMMKHTIRMMPKMKGKRGI